MIPDCKLWPDSSFQHNGVKSGNSAQFIAVNSEYLSIADNPALSMGDIDFMIAGWFYFDSVPGLNVANHFLGKWSGEYLVNIENISGTLRLRFWVRNTANTVTTGRHADTLGTPVINTWYFIVVWHDAVNNTLNIQVNNGGVDTTSGYTGGVRDFTTTFTIGSAAGGASPMGGRSHDVIVAKQIYTAAEKTFLYNSGNGRRFEELGLAGTDGANINVASGGVAYFKLGEESGTRADSWGANTLTDNATVTQNDGVSLKDPIDGDYVRQLTDLSGNGYNFTQTGNVTIKPKYITGVLNGKPAIRFDGTDDRLTNTTKANWQFMHDGTDFTAFIVWKATSSNPLALFGLMGNSNSTNVGVEIGYTDVGVNPDALRMRIINATPAAIVSIVANNTWSNPDTAKILTVHYDNGAAGDDANLYVNGGSSVVSANTTGTHSAVDSTGNMDIGTFGSGDSSFFAGDIFGINVGNK